MPRTIHVETVIPAPIEDVWDDLAVLSSHAEWMHDAERIEFVGDQRDGVGTRLKVLTRVGPFRLMDELLFTGWDPPRRMAVRHEGIVTGDGIFDLRPEGASTRLHWEETLTFPWYLGGRLTELAASVVLRWVWRRNLAAFADRFS